MTAWANKSFYTGFGPVFRQGGLLGRRGVKSKDWSRLGPRVILAGLPARAKLAPRGKKQMHQAASNRDCLWWSLGLCLLLIKVGEQTSILQLQVLFSGCFFFTPRMLF